MPPIPRNTCTGSLGVRGSVGRRRLYSLYLAASDGEVSRAFQKHDGKPLYYLISGNIG